jgi:multidrug efflux pump subunit AcrA (membrane-fusion protein)
MQFAQMLQLKEMGVPISPEDLLEAATLQNKQRIIDNLTKTEQAQQQQQQQQAEMAMQLQQAQIELAQARAKADIGLYEERTSRVDENRALAIQKLHEANSDDEKAMLDKVKALKELETMDLEHIERLINMSNSLREQERLASESIANKEVAELKGAQ